MDLREAFPGAAIATPLTILGEGFGSVAIATANGLVFRIAKHAEAQQGHQRERDVLPVVQRSGVGLRVPEVAYFLEASTPFPFGVIGYAKIPGRPLAPADLTRDNCPQVAGQVAAFLRALHGIDVDHLHHTDLPRFPPSPTRLRGLWQNVSAYLEKHVSRVEYGQVQQRQEDLLAYGQRYPYTPTLVHGDCWYENLLFDAEQQRLVGIIDFENVSIGDAALDLATQRYLGDRFAQEVIAAYYPDHAPADLSARMGDLLAVRELLGLEQGILLGKIDADALEKIKTTILPSPAYGRGTG